MIYLDKFVDYYPDIHTWFHKVLRERRFIVEIREDIYSNDRFAETIAIGIYDRKQGKLCHLSSIVLEKGLTRYMFEIIKAKAIQDGHKRLFCTCPENKIDNFVTWSKAKEEALFHFPKRVTQIDEVYLTIEL